MLAVVATIIQVKSHAELAVPLVTNQAPSHLPMKKASEGELTLKLSRGKFMRRTSTAAVKIHQEQKLQTEAEFDSMMADILVSEEGEFQRKLGDAFSEGKGEVGRSNDQKWDHESHDFDVDFLSVHGFDDVDLPDHLDLPEFVHHELDFGDLLNTPKVAADPSSETTSSLYAILSIKHAPDVRIVCGYFNFF